MNPRSVLARLLRKPAAIERPCAPEPTSVPPPEPPPGFKIDQEVRFAVVMYGGVSLAIYVNGIAEELLRLVRATSPRFASRSSPGSGRDPSSDSVYRTIGRMITSRGPTLARRDLDSDAPIRTRFIVDVLSGTSAGGINAVFLAKALVSGASLANLRRLWFTEADISVLLNDEQSIKDSRVDKHPGKFPRSLLNGRRMYRELLAALAAMERRAEVDPNALADVDELDLFVTATDLAGLPITLKLDIGLAEERRHKTVFHFGYRSRASLDTDRDDFVSENTPFLAFAARATSAFPVAFEPMRLADTQAAIAATLGTKAMPHFAAWRNFFREYLPARDTTALRSSRNGDDEERAAIERFAVRPFADGGYLDNKPFGYAIDAIVGRRARVKVDRKLLYIDPHPEKVSDEIPAPEDLSFFDNAAAALTSLPRYETIREDLERILQQNRTVERFRRVTEAMEHQQDVIPRAISLPGQRWSDLDLADGLKHFGPSYGGYHRLKVASVTDELANLVARLLGFSAESAEAIAIRLIVRYWRITRFRPYRKNRRDMRTDNAFLLDLDHDYRLRRIRFVAQRLERLIDGRERLQDGQGRTLVLRDEDRDSVRERLDSVRNVLHFAERTVVIAHQVLVSRDSPLIPELNRVVLFEDDLHVVAKQASDRGRWREARHLVLWRWGRPKQSATSAVSAVERVPLAMVIDDLAAIAGHAYRSGFSDASDSIRKNLTAPPTDPEPVRAALALLRSYYEGYEVYDMLLFPATYAMKGAGEADTVDVVRISPQDAVNIVDEATGQKKLYGTALMNFGAFLDIAWRKSDRLWGRLDGAERIITALLRNHPDRQTLITEAQIAIIREELINEQSEDLFRVLSTDVLGLLKTSDGLMERLSRGVKE